MAQRVGPVTLEDDDRDEDRTIVDVRALVSKPLPFALCMSVSDLKMHQFRVQTMFVFVVFQRAAVPTRRHLCYISAGRNL